MGYRFIIFLIQLAVLSGFLQLSAASARAQAYCSDPVGTLVSIQGNTQFRPAGTSVWQRAHINGTLCAGDVLRVGPGGRAAVSLKNETILRINQNSTLNFGSANEGFSLLNLLDGVFHIFSHRPRSLKVMTPYVNGIVEGTEFLVRSGEGSSTISVFEGRVRAENQWGAVELSSGQTASAAAQSPPEYVRVVTPRDAVHWTLYYPALLDSSFSGAQEGVRSRLVEAQGCLTTGRVTEAQTILENVLSDDPGNADALALLAIIAVVQNNHEQALGLARQAADLSEHSPAAGLALSYARQVVFDVQGALSVLEDTAEKNAENGLVKARLAELQLSVGQLEKAVETARKAVELAPNVGRTHAVLGFAYLAMVEIEEAESAFQQAIKRDQALPLARLGLGLTFIRSGNLREGRAEIEIAAALDPASSLIRSYLGKAYYEEKRDAQARRQYLLAKELDPADPTPWFYDALRKQTVHRPVEALHDLQRSIRLNDNRAVFRSRFLLDDDLAVRSASLGRIFQDLGFQQRALAEGWKSVAANPANFSAHRFLSDSYRFMPRHEIAQVSELLQSQLLQPINIAPVQPQLAESNLAILDGAGPGNASFNEYNPLFLRNRLALQASTIAGSNETLGDELSHSAVWNKLSYSLGQYYYRTDGIRDNNDREKTIYSGYIQGMLSPRTSLLAEFRYRDDTFGDTTLAFEPGDYSPSIRQADRLKSLRVGMRHDFQPNSTLLVTAISGASDSSGEGIEEFGVSVDISNTTDSTMAEIQHIYSSERISVQSGAGYLSSAETSSIYLAPPVDILSREDSATRHANVYTYAQLDLPYHLSASLGLAGDFLDSPVLDRDQLSPKLGFAWQPLHSTLLRGAVFRTLQRRLVYAQTIEPTHVSGFNQFFDDFPATSAWTYAIGVDHTFRADLFAGIQFFRRNLDVPFTWLADPNGVPEQVEDDWREAIGSAYFYWAPAAWMTLGLEYYYEKLTHDQWEGPQEIKNLTTHRLSPRINVFHTSGLHASLQANYVEQSGEFGSAFVGFTPDSEEFWVVDLELKYRLPKRYGTLSFGVKNLFDKAFRFLDTDPANPRFLPDQQLFLSLTVSL